MTNLRAAFSQAITRFPAFSAIGYALPMFLIALLAVVTQPQAVAQKAYVTNPGSNTVSVFLTSTNALCTTSTCASSATYPIPVSVSPGQVVVSHDGTKAYVGTGSSVIVINTATDAVTATVAVSGGVGALALVPNDSALYAVGSAGGGTNNIVAINTSTNTVAATISLPAGASTGVITGLAASPDGSSVFALTQQGFGEVDPPVIFVASTSSNTITSTISPSTLTFNSALAVSPDGSTAYVVDAYGLQALSIATGSITSTISLPTVGRAEILSNDGSLAYVSDSSNNLYVVSLGRGAVVNTLTVGSGQAFSNDGTKLYTVSSTPTISYISTISYSTLGTVTAGSTVGGIGIRPPVPGQPGELSGASICGCITNTGTATAGEPIDVASGNMAYTETDYTTVGQNPLAYQRFYNSRSNVAGFSTLATALGINWRSNFDRYIQINSSTKVTAERASGRQYVFFLVGSTWTTNSDVDVTLTHSGTIWTLTDHDDTVETYTTATSGTEALLNTIKSRNGYTQTLSYNTSNLLQTVTDSYSRTLTITYNTNNLVYSVANPDSQTITYAYTAGGSGYNLTSISYPTTQTVTYVYENSALPNALTGVVDEASNRYLTWAYDGYARGTTSQVGNGPNAAITTVSYTGSTGTRIVTNPLGVNDTYSFAVLQGVPKLTGISRAATSTTAAMTRAFSYDTGGFMASQTDWNGNSTTYTNNAHGQPTTIHEAVGSSVARTTTIAYDATFVHLPDSIATPGVTTSFTYDGSGEPLTRTLTDTTTTTVPYSTSGQTRTWTYTWSSFLLASVKNPRTDVTATTSFAYTGGALTSITDPLTHATTITSYTGGGRPLTIVDPNSVTTTLTYDGRQRPLTSAVGTTGGPLTTSWTYHNNSDVTTTLPDGSGTVTLLDSAHRYTGFANNDNEQNVKTLDANGDPIERILFNGSGTLSFWRVATFDALGRQLKDTSTVTTKSITRTIDNNGNALTITDPLSHSATQVFDALNRLYKITDANGGITQFTFDTHDRPLTVSDPDSNSTSYVYNGFGNVIQEASPDRGTTVYHYDGDANLTQKIDGASVTTNYTYDKLDRMLTTTYPADSTLNVAYTYDQTGTGYGKGVGRLTSLTDAAGSLSRSYDERGNTLTEKRIIGTNTLTTTYSYDAASRVASTTYPSGAVSSYNRDPAGYIKSMPFSATGSDQTYSLWSITHLPFGQANFIYYNNGDRTNLAFDWDYRITNLEYDAYGGTAYFKWAYNYDYANNVSSTTDGVTSANSQTFGYDVLNRLTSASSSGTYGTLAWAYDNNGNLTSKTVGTTGTTYGYTTGTNRLATAATPGFSETSTYSGTGNLTSNVINGTPSFTGTYSKANRLTTVTSTPIAITGMTYDAFGKRLTKTDPGFSPTLYSYDLDGNLIEENDNGTITDYIYLDGVDVANWAPSEGHLYAINTDRIGTPVVSRDVYGLTNWAAYSTPYGAMTVTVSGGAFTGPVTQNLRLPGQTIDPESTLHHNGFRDFPNIWGRYIEADPIGLKGGLNPYRYANANPMIYTDKRGLATALIIGEPYLGNPAGHDALAFSSAGVYSYGTATPLGGDVISYLEDQSLKRDTTVIVFDTTPEQEQLMQAYFKTNYGSSKNYSWYLHNCSTAVDGALQAGGLNFGSSIVPMSEVEAVFKNADSSNPVQSTIYSIPKGGVVPPEFILLNKQ